MVIYQMGNRKHVVIGAIGGILLLTIYFGILTIANSFSHAIEQFLGFWYLITTLVTGFGIQVGLYSYIWDSMSAIAARVRGDVAATGGISTGSMIACCIHHLTDVLPIIGLSALAVFTAKYQISLMVLGILSNVVGVMIMLNIIQKNGLYERGTLLDKLLMFDMKNVRNLAIIISILILIIVFAIGI